MSSLRFWRDSSADIPTFACTNETRHMSSVAFLLHDASHCFCTLLFAAFPLILKNSLPMGELAMATSTGDRKELRSQRPKEASWLAVIVLILSLFSIPSVLSFFLSLFFFIFFLPPTSTIRTPAQSYSTSYRARQVAKIQPGTYQPCPGTYGYLRLVPRYLYAVLYMGPFLFNLCCKSDHTPH